MAGYICNIEEPYALPSRFCHGRGGALMGMSLPLGLSTSSRNPARSKRWLWPSTDKVVSRPTTRGASPAREASTRQRYVQRAKKPPLQRVERAKRRGRRPLQGRRGGMTAAAEGAA